jgi:hypothetical protein
LPISRPLPFWATSPILLPFSLSTQLSLLFLPPVSFSSQPSCPHPFSPHLSIFQQLQHSFSPRPSSSSSAASSSYSPFSSSKRASP